MPLLPLPDTCTPRAACAAAGSASRKRRITKDRNSTKLRNVRIPSCRKNPGPSGRASNGLEWRAREEVRVAAIPDREPKPRRTPVVQYRTRRGKPNE